MFNRLQLIGRWIVNQRNLIYVISWIGPAGRLTLPVPIAQIVFNLENVARLTSIGEFGTAAIQKGVLQRPQPSYWNTERGKLFKTVKTRSQKTTQRLRPNVHVLELLEGGFALSDNVEIVQLESGDYQITINYSVSPSAEMHFNPPIHIVGADENPNIHLSEVFIVPQLEWVQLVLGFINQAEGVILQSRFIDGVENTDDLTILRRFDRGPDPGAGGGASAFSTTVNTVFTPFINLHYKEFLKDKFLKNTLEKQNLFISSAINAQNNSTKKKENSVSSNTKERENSLFIETVQHTEEYFPRLQSQENNNYSLAFSSVTPSSNLTLAKESASNTLLGYLCLFSGIAALIFAVFLKKK